MVVLTRAKLRQIGSVLQCINVSRRVPETFSALTIHSLIPKKRKQTSTPLPFFVLVVIFKFLSVVLRKLNGRRMCVLLNLT